MTFMKGNSFGFKKGYIPWNKDKKTGLSPMLGKKHSEETKEKISLNNAHYWKGKTFSENHKEKLSENHADFKEEKSPNWKGGSSRNRECEKEWRISVFNRDNYCCKKCNLKNGEGKTIQLNSHHIENYSSNLEKRFDIDNGITLCKDCHKLFHITFGYKNNNKNQIDCFLEKGYNYDR
jgi:hypothetical protein